MDWKSNSTPKKPKKNLCSSSRTKVMLTFVFGTETLSENKFLAAEILSANKCFDYNGTLIHNVVGLG